MVKTCALVWIAQLLIFGLLLGQHHLSVLHPLVIPFFGLLFCLVGLLFFITYQLVRCSVKREDLRIAVISWAIAMVPVAGFVNCFWYSQQQWAVRRVPRGIRFHVASIGGGSLMEAHAQYGYPNRMECDRLTMFYRDLENPAQDLAAMARHVEELEDEIGRPLRSKIHWVRGPLLGQRHMSFLGLALGSNQRLRSIDYHEVAHAVLTQYRTTDADPPMILHEGWAEARSLSDRHELSEAARIGKEQRPDVRIVDLFNPDNYHLDKGLAYGYGGAFVDFLIRKYSIRRFVRIYNQCRVESFEDDFQHVYGVSIYDLERQFWHDVESTIREPDSSANPRRTKG